MGPERVTVGLAFDQNDIPLLACVPEPPEAVGQRPVPLLPAEPLVALWTLLQAQPVADSGELAVRVVVGNLERWRAVVADLSDSETLEEPGVELLRVRVLCQSEPVAHRFPTFLPTPRR
jgi:hypothetical protein